MKENGLGNSILIDWAYCSIFWGSLIFLLPPTAP